ncbi:hypothetical protein [Amycolatopsis anabasis]|uniref:hypothetical protein n=1 Tax=Amycolatopsis anabasis TaxID=1840409 RepID=UPI00131A9655|nr:hypothetical protein [Amycolatopsis anabasis]
MRVTGYSYPWDVAEPGFADRAGELGVDEVAVAVAYHTTRAATPWSSGRTAVLARHAALYRPVRAHVWDGARLRPATADWAGGQDSAGDAVRALNAAGIPAAAWIVLTHSSRLGSEFPEAAVRNCFGEPYPWALCPARREVREYAATLTAESLADLDVSSVVLEACGQLGVLHQCHHEKTDAVWAPAVARLLSVCCCTACAARWADTGLDPDEVRGRLRDEVRRLIETGDLTVTGDKLPRGLGNALLATRQRAADELRRGVLAEIRPGIRIVLHGAVDPWVTGALPGLTPAAAGDVNAVVLPCWQPGAGSLDAVEAARAQLPSTVDVGAYVTAVAANPVPDIEAYVTGLGRAGAAELHLYHLGLAGPGRWPDLHAAIRGAREPASRS